MSRLKRFAHSLLSGYVMLGTNILYTLASVSLAMHYLPIRAEFGLWALTSQIMVYLNMVDLGLGGSASRILIDYKDRRKGGEYGGVVQTTALVGLVQGGIVCIVGLGLALVMGPLFRQQVPADMQTSFFWLLAGQSLITGANMATKVFSLLLSAHQRYDISNYAGTLSFAANFAAMWICFAKGMGIYSLLAGQTVGLLVNIVASAGPVQRLGFLPGHAEWGRPSWVKFRELFGFAQNIFLYSIGAQLVGASQTILLGRLVSLDAASVWSVNTRAYGMLTVVIYRVFDFSSSALAEMMVRNELSRLKHRFRQIIELSMSLAVAGGVMFALGNSLFVQIWMHGKTNWLPINDLLLAIWLVLCVAVHAHTGLVGQSKVFRFLRFIFLFEGGMFVGLMFLLHQLGVVTPMASPEPADGAVFGPGRLHEFHSISVMLLLSIGSCLCFSFPYGLYRTCKYFDISGWELLQWHRQSLWLAAGLIPVAAGAWWCMHQRNLSLSMQLAVVLPVLGLWTLFAFLRFGLSAGLQGEIVGRLPILKKIIRVQT